jgi:diacylglycerol kinase family enzyme
VGGSGHKCKRGAPERVLVIGRERTGRPVAAVVAEVGLLVAAEGVRVDTKVVKHKREVRRTTTDAVRNGCDLIVAVGGDGLVQQVATVLEGTKVGLGIVPTGTGNLLAGNLEIPEDHALAVGIALGGRRRRIDVGRLRVDGKRRAFTVACGVGFDANVMARTDSEQKGRWGKLAYVANAVLEAGNIHDVPHDITIDGVRRRTDSAQVLIANFGRIAPALTAKKVRPDDGRLDVFIIHAGGPLPALMAGWAALRQTDLGSDDGGRVYHARARSVRIATTPRRRVETDGGFLGRTPISVSIRPRALTVMVPRT